MKSVLSVSINDVVEFGENLWFIPKEYNALCKYSKINGYIDYMTYVPNERMEAGQLYSAIIVFSKYLILVPYGAEEVALFDTERLAFEKLKLPILNSRYRYRRIAKFYGGIQVEDRVYLLPGEYPEIVCVNMQTKKVETIKEWYPLYGSKPLSMVKECGSYKGIESSICHEQNELYVSFFADDKGVIGKFSFDSYNMEIYTIEGVNSYFSCMENYGETLFFTTRYGQIIGWNKKQKMVVEAFAIGEESEIKAQCHPLRNAFYGSVLWDDKIYYFLTNQTKYIEFDIKQKKVKKYSFKQLKVPIRKVCMFNKGTYLLTTETSFLYEYTSDKKIEVLPLYIEDEVLQSYYLNAYLNNDLEIREMNSFGLKKLISQLTGFNGRRNWSDNNIGKEIYNSIK